MFMPRPHDLLWLNQREALQGDLPGWVASQWRPGLPVVVRRDVNHNGLIPVGVRGIKRDQRAAGWADSGVVTRVITPDTLAVSQRLLRSPFVSQPPVQAAIVLASEAWPWTWGITGSTGYALATEIPVLHAASDLDLILYAPIPISTAELLRWQAIVNTLPCRVDTQVETPFGAFALNEWLREQRVLLKTNAGPRLTNAPWQQEIE